MIRRRRCWLIRRCLGRTRWRFIRASRRFSSIRRRCRAIRLSFVGTRWRLIFPGRWLVGTGRRLIRPSRRFVCTRWSFRTIGRRIWLRCWRSISCRLVGPIRRLRPRLGRWLRSSRFRVRHRAVRGSRRWFRLAHWNCTSRRSHLRYDRPAGKRSRRPRGRFSRSVGPSYGPRRWSDCRGLHNLCPLNFLSIHLDGSFTNRLAVLECSLRNGCNCAR